RRDARRADDEVPPRRIRPAPTLIAHPRPPRRRAYHRTAVHLTKLYLVLTSTHRAASSNSSEGQKTAQGRWEVGMSSVIKRAMVAVGVLLVSAVGAQAETLEVKVPFAFIVGSTQMLAGTYRLERDSSSASVMLIRGEHGNTAQAFVLTTPLKGGSPAG